MKTLERRVQRLEGQISLRSGVGLVALRPDESQAEARGRHERETGERPADWCFVEVLDPRTGLRLEQPSPFRLPLLGVR